jgi:hypothetical protein
MPAFRQPIKDAQAMGLRVLVREGETVQHALHRLKVLLARHNRRRGGPFRWLFFTKDYYQKPSLRRRMKRVRQKFRAARAERFRQLPR